ncbi:serine/threonine-protein kinase [Plantactinospora sonchi]|uniref:Serine/threonine-protein kinase n=1 Tax=Plantactinospora sonchi TaxID=1544735 RepID=A0ABU7S2L3_9ACTN
MDEQQVLGGRYRLEEQLGQGGMAVVWRARDEVLGRSVAVKLLAGPHARDPVSRRRIRHEARAAAALSHPNIAQVYDYGESVTGLTCLPYVVMELVPGPTLEQRVAAEPVSPRLAFRICAEVAAALTAAHAQGLVHRDIKPGNVLLPPSGAKVVDFGIAAAVSPDSDAVEWGDELLGTPGYLAPERITGDTVEPASDVYGVGLLLYRLLAGQMPWSTETATEMLRAHVYVAPPPLPPLPGVPARVVELCHRCLAKEPAQRPTAREVAAVLARAAGVRVVQDEPAYTAAPTTAEGEPSTVLVPRPPVGSDGAVRTRRPRPHALAGTAAGVAGLVVAGMLFWLADPLGSDQGPRVGPVPPAPPGQSTNPQPAETPQGGTSGTPSPGSGPMIAGGSEAPSGAPLPVPGASGQPPASPIDLATTPPPATSAPPTPSVSSPPEPSPSVERTLGSAGGSVRATCTADGDARLLSWTATPPYRVAQVEPGPARSATVTFRHGNKVVHMTVACRDGVPTAVNSAPG